MMSLSIPQLLVMLGAALLAIALFAPRTGIVPRLPAVTFAAADGIAGPHVTPEQPRVSWPELLDRSVPELDDDARRALLEALVAIGEAWCAPILRAASAQEHDDALSALARAGLDALNLGVAPEAHAA